MFRFVLTGPVHFLGSHAFNKAAHMRKADKSTNEDAMSAHCALPAAVELAASSLVHEMLERLPQGVVVFDSAGQLEFANRRFAAIYAVPPEQLKPGISLEQLHSLCCGSLVLSEEARELCRSVCGSIRAGQVAAGTYETIDGRTIHVINTPLPTGGWIATHEDISYQRDAERQIEYLASHDPLTDLPNRSSFREQLEHALRFNPKGKSLAVMFIDLDNFKAINDTLGHDIGDDLLRKVGERIRSCMGSSDTAARFSGDDFVVLSWALEKPSQAAMLASLIRDEILKPYDLAEHHVVIDASIGIAIAPGDGTDADSLLKNADLALYSAKGAGRGTYHFFEQEMDVRMMERRSLEIDLRAALTNGEFELHYQPLIDLQSGAVSGCEALLRWNQPQRGAVSPQVFIPLAEETGLITSIGEWVLRTACRAASSWPEEVTVAVNVSPIQFRGKGLVQTVTNALAASGLAPRRLEVEITETVLLERTDETLAILNQLHGLGVRISMDDFGTGYSSLSYLQKFPFDKIKIDRAFISGLADEGEAAAIVRAVTGIAETFQMKTTAEGVETERQRTIAASLGCTEMQGNLFSAALPADEIAELLALHAARGSRRAA